MAVACGVDALGLNFFPGSSRFIELEQAREIARVIPGFVTLVGLFVDSDADRVRRFAAEIGLELLQFHGDESPAYCESFDHGYLKAVAGSSAEAISSAATRYASSRALLLDTAAAGQFGGTGQRFDWSVIPKVSVPLALAGGITPDNVQEAISTVNPWAIDVSSGVERRKGVKDVEKVSALMAAIAEADSRQNTNGHNKTSHNQTPHNNERE